MGLVIISRQYDNYLTYMASGMVPVFIPIEHNGKSRLYQAVIVPTPEQTELIHERPQEFALAAVDAVRGMAWDDGYEPKE